ncbi:unnamed protein product, partial [Phaeothamnion confervicola]
GVTEVLVVAGDVSSGMRRARDTLQLLKEKFHEASEAVVFVAGNHDLWVNPKPSEHGGDFSSVRKLLDTFDMCRELGVRVDPVCFSFRGGADIATAPAAGLQRTAAAATAAGSGRADAATAAADCEELWLVPLLSWYHASWDREPDLPPELQYRNGDFLRRWGDFRRCRWPESVCRHEDFVSITSESTAVSNLFASLNDDCLTAAIAEASLLSTSSVLVVCATASANRDSCHSRHGRHAAGKSFGHSQTPPNLWESARFPCLQIEASRWMGRRVSVASLSHFLPRQELCPEKRFLVEPMLPKVIGSDALERQVRALRPSVHVFGHTHIPIDLQLEGIRYVQWPLGSPREQTRQCRVMRDTGPLLL